MEYNEYYDRGNGKILILIIIIAIIILGIGGLLLFGNIGNNKPISEKAEEVICKDKKGNIIARYSVIEMKKKNIDFEKVKEWSMDYATPNFNNYDMYIIKYKDGKETKCILYIDDNLVSVGCNLIEHENGQLETSADPDEVYTVSFKDGNIIKEKYTKDGVKHYTWDTDKKDWGKIDY